MLIPTILTPFIYSLLVLAVEAHNSRLKQTTRRQVTERASLHFRPRQATTSSTLFPTCPESQTHASTPYATFSKVAYFNTDNYFIFPAQAASDATECADQCDQNQDCVAAALRNGQCFLYNQRPSSLKEDGGYQTLIKGGCSAVPPSLADSNCCNTYPPE